MLEKMAQKIKLMSWCQKSYKYLAPIFSSDARKFWGGALLILLAGIAVRGLYSAFMGPWYSPEAVTLLYPFLGWAFGFLPCSFGAYLLTRLISYSGIRDFLGSLFIFLPIGSLGMILIVEIVGGLKLIMGG